VAGLILFLNRQPQQAPQPQEIVAEENLPTLLPSEIGMVVTVRSDKRAIMFELKKAQNIKRVEYQILYGYVVDGQKQENGFLGEMNIAEDGITKTDYWPFGTCSSGVCRYDKDVSNVRIFLKVEMKDGKIYQVQKAVEL
jgi:hypothetical protein